MKENVDVEIVTFKLQYPSFLFPGKTQYSDADAPADMAISEMINSVCPTNWLGAPSGVIRKDNSVKPSYELLMEMTKKRWTTDLKVKTDEEGYAYVEGYRGQYEIVAGDERSEFVLDKSGDLVEIVI